MIVKSPVEVELEKLHLLLGKCQPQAKEVVLGRIFELLKKDSSFQSQQLYASCVESNFTTVEEEMASPFIRKVLEKYTLTHLVDELGHQVLKGNYASEIDLVNIVHKHAREKVQTLSKDVRVKLLTTKQIKVNSLKDIPFPVASFTQAEKEAFIKCINEGQFDLQDIPKIFRNDRDVVLAAVRKDGLALRFASEDLKNDVGVVAAALHQNGMALEFIPKYQNTNAVFNAINNTWKALQFASKDFKNNKKLILDMVSFYGGGVLTHASEELTADKKFILECLNVNPNAYLYLPDVLKNDREIVNAFLLKTPVLFSLIPPQFRNNPEVVLSLYRYHPNHALYSLNSVSEQLLKDRKFAIKLMKIKGAALEKLSKEFQDDREIVKIAIKQYPQALRDVSNRLKKDIRIVKRAVELDGMALEHASKGLRDNREIVLLAMSKNKEALQFASERLKAEFREAGS